MSHFVSTPRISLRYAVISAFALSISVSAAAQAPPSSTPPSSTSPSSTPPSSTPPSPAPQPPAAAAPAPAAPAAPKPGEPAQPPAVGTPAVVLDGGTTDTLLGKPVQSADGEDMGRIIDVIVDHSGTVRAAIIDFGGFLGVGTRKIAVDWRVLHFSQDGSMDRITAELSRDQLRVAPVYKTGEPIVVVGRADAAPAAPAPAAPPPPSADSSAPKQDAPAKGP